MMKLGPISAAGSGWRSIDAVRTEDLILSDQHVISFFVWTRFHGMLRTFEGILYIIALRTPHQSFHSIVTIGQTLHAAAMQAPCQKKASTYNPKCDQHGNTDDRMLPAYTYIQEMNEM